MEVDSTPKYKTTVLNIGLLKLDSRVATSWRLKKMLIVPMLIIHARISGDRLQARTLLSSTTSHWGCCKKWICRLCWCFSTFSFCSLEVFEQRVSGTMDRTDWTNSMDCRSPDLNHLDLYFLGYSKSAVYSTLWRPVLATVNIHNAFEVIRTTAVIFQRVRQSLSRRTRSCLEAHGGHWLFSVIMVAVSRKPCFRGRVFISFPLCVV